jgi:hypothetical protein
MPHVAYDVSFCKNVRSVGYNDSAAVIIDRASGSPDPSRIYLGGSEPIVNLQSTDLATLVALNTATFVSAGLCVSGSSTTIPIAKRADCGVLASGGAHLTFVGNNCFIVPTSFEVRQDSEEGATCNLDVRFQSTNGITAPITTSNTASLSSATLGTTFGLGKAFVDDTELDFLTGLVINPGMQVLMHRYGGGIFPMKHYIDQRTPTIDILCEDAGLAHSFINRYSSGNTDVRVFFRARADGSVYAADDASSHIKFSFASAFVKMDVLDAAQSGNGSVTIRCTGKALVAAVSQAIE